MAAPPTRPASTWLYLVPIAIAVIALALVAYFDLQTNLSFNDEYARRWTIQRFMDGRGLALWGTNPGLVQLAAAGLVALLHTEPRFWRLAVLPFMALAGYFSWRIALRLGADWFWAAVSVAAVVAGPITLSMATGLMTETVFLGLFLGACWFALRWVLDGKGTAWCVLWTVLATLQRPQGAGVVLGVTIGLWLASKSRRLSRGDLLGLVVVWLGVIVAYEIPNHLFRGVAAPGNASGLQSGSQLAYAVSNVVTLPVMLGLLLLPFAAGMLSRAAGEGRKLGRVEMIPVGFAFAGIVGAGKLILGFHTDLLPGNILGTWGLGPPTVAGTKVALLPLPLLLTFELIALGAALVILIWRRRAWEPRLLGTGGVVLTVLAISQFLPLLVYAGLFDRYFVLVAAPLAPLLAAMVSASHWRPRLSMAWAITFLCLGLGTYVIGQQDYTSWQVARDVAARAAYAQAPASQVDAGYEEIAEHVRVPAADNPALPPQLVKNPLIYLVFTSRDDPRPGVSYSSLAPGRIIIVHVP